MLSDGLFHFWGSFEPIFRSIWRGVIYCCRYDPRQMDRKSAKIIPKSDEPLVLVQLLNGCLQTQVLQKIVHAKNHPRKFPPFESIHYLSQYVINNSPNLVGEPLHCSAAFAPIF